jgi:hypothetical protein
VRRIRSHLTYANVMATLAVFLVLGGGAYAAFHLPKNSVKSKNIVNGQVKGVDVAERTLGQVPKARSANPTAFAHITTNGTVDAANSKGITQANLTYTGSGDDTYCFKRLPFRPRGGQVTVDYSDSPRQVQVFHFDLGTVVPCPSGTQAYVWGATGSASFYVAFYR